MTKNELEIQIISTSRKGFETYNDLLMGQLTETKEKAAPSHFLKFILASSTNGTFGFVSLAQVCKKKIIKNYRSIISN